MRHILVPVGFRVLPYPLVRSVRSAVASAVASAAGTVPVAATQEVVDLEVAFEEAAPDLVAELAFAVAAAGLR